MNLKQLLTNTQSPMLVDHRTTVEECIDGILTVNQVAVVQILTENLTTIEAAEVAMFVKQGLQAYADYHDQRHGADMLRGIGVKA